MSMANIPEGLYLIDLPQSVNGVRVDGFKNFISAWYFVDDMGRKIVVDPGPAGTIPLLSQKLSALTDSVDIVLLTHIHLDHSGGIGQFCEHWKGIKILAHPKAKKHLIDPTKLWKASIETLGTVADMYGAPIPLNPEYLLGNELEGTSVLETPGHAPHHLSFAIPFRGEKLFFVGEAAGLTLPMESSAALPYLRPTTPPKFDAAAALKSLEAIAQFLNGDELLCYSHWGAARNAKNRIAMAKNQLEEWLSAISKMSSEPIEKIAGYLLEKDPLLSGYAKLPEDLQKRERIFIGNSVKGFLGCLGYLNGNTKGG